MKQMVADTKEDQIADLGYEIALRTRSSPSVRVQTARISQARRLAARWGWTFTEALQHLSGQDRQRVDGRAPSIVEASQLRLIDRARAHATRSGGTIREALSALSVSV